MDEPLPGSADDLQRRPWPEALRIGALLGVVFGPVLYVWMASLLEDAAFSVGGAGLAALLGTALATVLARDLRRALVWWATAVIVTILVATMVIAVLGGLVDPAPRLLERSY
jgi:peptidoglycan/LPS O-acetylase OafA/YrhL